MHARTKTLALQASSEKPPDRSAAELDIITYPAAELEEDPERREDDGEDDVDAGRRAVRHLASCLLVRLPCIRSSWRALQARNDSERDRKYQRAQGRLAEAGGECDELMELAPPLGLGL